MFPVIRIAALAAITAYSVLTTASIVKHANNNHKLRKAMNLHMEQHMKDLCTSKRLRILINFNSVSSQPWLLTF